MAGHAVDLSTWERADQFRLFRSFAHPHFAVTTRLDLTHVMQRKSQGVSPYRACLFAIGAGLHAVPALCMRFRGDQITRYDAIALSMTVPRDTGSFGFGYLDWMPDFLEFDRKALAEINRVASNADFAPNSDAGQAVAYVSCLPWMDYTSLNNALPGPEDCIPRVSWGKIVPKGDGWDMAMTIEVHHALVDGAHVGAYFEAVQSALARI